MTNAKGVARIGGYVSEKGISKNFRKLNAVLNDGKYEINILKLENGIRKNVVNNTDNIDPKWVDTLADKIVLILEQKK